MQPTNTQGAQAPAKAPSKREARITAAVQAAETFGRTSLFQSSRVTGGALKFALEQMVKRTLNNTAGVSERTQVRIAYLGDGPARVRHEWGAVDNRGLRKSTAVIVLPDFADDALLPRAFADEYSAFCIHELAHIVYTNPLAFRRGIADIATKHALNQEQAQQIVNGLEDVRIERALMRDGVAVGFRAVVAALLGRMMQDAEKAGALTAFARGDGTAFGFGAAFALRKIEGAHYVPGGEKIRAAMTPKHRAVLDYAEAMLATVKDDANGTAAVCDIADECIRRLGLTREGQQGGQGAGQGNPGPQPSQDPAQPSQDPAQPSQEGQEGAAGGPQPSQEGEGQDAGQDKAQEGQEGGQDGAAGAQEGEGQDGAQDAGQGTPGQSTVEGAATDAKAAPAPWTFKSEPTPCDVPEAAKPEAGTSEIYPPKVEPVDKTAQNDAAGARTLAEAMAGVVYAGALSSALRRLFSRTDRDSLETGRRSGKVRAGQLWRADTGAVDIFARRTIMDGTNSACAILIDGSGSMSHLSRDANKAVAVLVKVLAGCPGVKTQVSVFQGAAFHSDVDSLTEQAAADAGIHSRGEAVRLRLLKDWNDSPATAYSGLSDCYANGGTPDNAAVRGAGRMLAKRKEGRKVLVVIVDGGTNRHDAMRAEVDSLERQGVTVIAIGIGMRPSLRAFPHSVGVSSVADLGGAAFRLMLDAVRKRDEGSAA